VTAKAEDQPKYLSVTGGTVTTTDISEPDDGKTRDASPEEPARSNIEVKRVKKPSKSVFGPDWTI